MPMHRRPPLPHWSSGPGRCRWCGEPVLRAGLPTRSYWHPACKRAYEIAVFSTVARIAVSKRDRGVCVDCRRKAGYLGGYAPQKRPSPLDRFERAAFEAVIDSAEGRPVTVVQPVRVRSWEVDHGVPLYAVDRSLPWAELVAFWSLKNLFTRCTPCHRAKTARDREIYGAEGECRSVGRAA